MRNFNFPFRSKTISEFWGRWHISLSTWLRDYIYLPLILSFSKKMNKVKSILFNKETRIYSLATIITFLISGIWHGAAWTFVILGALHGFYLVFANITKKVRKNINHFILLDRIPWLFNAIQIVLTFILVNIGFLFFRSKNVETAWYILRSMFTHPLSKLYPGESQWITMISILLIFILLILESLQIRGWISVYFSKSRVPRPLRWAGYIALLIMICILGVTGDRFIYFQF
jgi:alginate O-acetyltransferase complex protein AlgI